MAIPKVTIIDYGIGNIDSVASAMKYFGVEVESVSDPDMISKADTLVLPGVGSFNKGMEALSNLGIDDAIKHAVINRGSEILGICLGMQLMGAYGTEHGEVKGLGLIPNTVDSFKESELRGNKIPHVGFNSVKLHERVGLFKDLPNLPDFYFTHSYRMLVNGFTGRYATCDYGVEFLAAFERDNICGTQFHPEKSQTNGLILLKNFLEK